MFSLSLRLVDSLGQPAQRGALMSWSARWRRSFATRVDCGRPATGSGALPGRVIRAVSKPTLLAPRRSHTWAATIMQSAGVTPSASHAYRYTDGAGLKARHDSTLS